MSIKCNALALGPYASPPQIRQQCEGGSVKPTSALSAYRRTAQFTSCAHFYWVEFKAEAIIAHMPASLSDFNLIGFVSTRRERILIGVHARFSVISHSFASVRFVDHIFILQCCLCEEQ